MTTSAPRPIPIAQPQGYPPAAGPGGYGTSPMRSSPGRAPMASSPGLYGTSPHSAGRHSPRSYTGPSGSYSMNAQSYQPPDPQAYAVPPSQNLHPNSAGLPPNAGYGASPPSSYHGPPSRPPQHARGWSYGSANSHSSHHSNGNASSHRGSTDGAYPSDALYRYRTAQPMPPPIDEYEPRRRPRFYSVDERPIRSSRPYRDDEYYTDPDSEYEYERERRRRDRKRHSRTHSKASDEIDARPTLADSTLWAFGKVKSALGG